MSETVNIAALASTVSEKIFSAFGWDLHEITDENFPCSKVDKHQTKGAGEKHPIDCVFSYSDPFSNKRVYFNFDLKSYAKSTIQTTDFAPYIRSLAKGIDCARSSPDWKNKYVDPGVDDWTIEALLFVYNHDNGYDKDFRRTAKGLAPASLQQPRSARVHLIAPDDISYLQSVISDFKGLCAEFDWSYAKRRFFYPQQVINPPGESLLATASIEMIRGKLVMFSVPSDSEHYTEFVAYLRCGGSVQDFEYIITFFYRKGVMSLASKLWLKGADFVPDAQQNFDVAKKQFLKRHYEMKEINDSLARIVFGRVDRVVSNFSTIDESKRRAR